MPMWLQWALLWSASLWVGWRVVRLITWAAEREALGEMARADYEARTRPTFRPGSDLLDD